jgi:hypothetical protein
MSVIRGVRVDGEIYVLNFGSGLTEYVHLLCPECGMWNLIDKAQERGATSVVCDNVKRGTCTFHETHDWKDGKLIGPPESFDSDLAGAATRWIGVRLRKGEWPTTDNGG